MNALIVYHSKTGHTRQAADDIARGLVSEGVEADVKAADGLSGKGALDGYDIVLFGTPTYGNRRYNLPAKPVDDLMKSLAPGGLEGKTVGAFTVFAGYGGGKLVTNMEGSLAGLGGKVVGGGPAVKAGAPLSLWKGPDAKPADTTACEEFGRKVARLAGI
ncbi:MAG: flavodoxin domain-containing protein [Actinobacteria bacterium]|nr:flavodoxin domain-containing protein [Actinomycetota bacterium]MBU1942357.1 flavodoxin domain-containing protein [Actinomycetota bacterium]MBU2686351.1 flavodoxin domain-containing protein [Actinomycetota bacterium]